MGSMDDQDQPEVLQTLVMEARNQSSKIDIQFAVAGASLIVVVAALIFSVIGAQ